MLDEIEEQLMEDLDGNGDSLQGTAPNRDEAVDQGIIMKEDVPTRALFGTVAKCCSKLESIAIECNAADAALYLRWAKQVLLKVLNPKKTLPVHVIGVLLV